MPRLLRKAGPVGLALTLVDLWRRLPPEQRQQAIEQARKHGPKLISKAMRARKRR